MKMLDDLNFFLKIKKDLNLNIFDTRRQPQFLEDGRQPHFYLNGRPPKQIAILTNSKVQHWL